MQTNPQLFKVRSGGLVGTSDVMACCVFFFECKLWPEPELGAALGWLGLRAWASDLSSLSSRKLGHHITSSDNYVNFGEK